LPSRLDLEENPSFQDGNYLDKGFGTSLMRCFPPQSRYESGFYI